MGGKNSMLRGEGFEAAGPCKDGSSFLNFFLLFSQLSHRDYLQSEHRSGLIIAALSNMKTF